jgi:CoA:oxalate CoA-transferase
MSDLYPLGGLRVLDLSRVISGPYAGRILSDLGADVVKLEMPGTDISRVLGDQTSGPAGLYVQQNVGKRNIAVDLSTSNGADLARRLIERSDVVIENFRPGVLDKLGLGWATLTPFNPGLVLLSISGFGQWGPESQRRAYAPVLHAEAGLLARQADADDGQHRDLVLALADSAAATHGAIAVLAALRLRDQTGRGQHIDMSMFEALLSTDDYSHFTADSAPVWATRGRTFDAPGGPILISGDPKHMWVQLSRHAGLVDPEPDAPTPFRIAARDRAMVDWVRGFQDREQLKRELDRVGLAWADIRRGDEVLQSPTVVARGAFAPLPEAGEHPRLVVQTPYRFSDASTGPTRGAAACGQHNREVLTDWLDLSDDEIARLTASRAVIERASGPIPTGRARSIPKGRSARLRAEEPWTSN